MANFVHLAVCALLSLQSTIGIVHGYPISPEDVVSLLPEIPKTKNETVAAIVQDAVIQNAVVSVVGNGTLSGLVVKKNTVILPADQPDVILTHNEQILTAPLSHLEDIRKNITETAAAITEKENSEVTAVDEISLSEVVPLDEKITSETPISEKSSENPAEILIADSLILEEKETTKSPKVTLGEKLEVPGIVESEIRLPEGIFPHDISLPIVIHDEIAKPVVAVLNPINVATVQESVIDLLPGPVESSDKDSLGNPDPDEAEKEVLQYGERIPVTALALEKLEPPAVKIEGKNQFLVAEERSSYDQNDEDMVAAEDMIFRPLFRYRQQQNDRLRLLENRAYQRGGYRGYQPYSSYDNYNSRRYSYRKAQRSRYYDDDY